MCIEYLSITWKLLCDPGRGRGICQGQTAIQEIFINHADVHEV